MNKRLYLFCIEQTEIICNASYIMHNNFAIDCKEIDKEAQHYIKIVFNSARQETKYDMDNVTEETKKILEISHDLWDMWHTEDMIVYQNKEIKKSLKRLKRLIREAKRV